MQWPPSRPLPASCGGRLCLHRPAACDGNGRPLSAKAADIATALFL
jgi:hypothetical protein